MSLSRRTLAGKTKADHALDLRRQLDLCTAGVNVGDKSGCSQASLGKVPENKTPVGATEADSEVTHIIIPFMTALIRPLRCILCCDFHRSDLEVCPLSGRRDEALHRRLQPGVWLLLQAAD